MSEQNREGASPERRSALGADLIIPLLAAGLTIYFLASTSSLVWEARANGTVIGAVLLILIAMQALKVGRQLRARQGILSLGDLVERSPVQAQRLGLFAIMTLFILVIPWVGTTLGLLLSMLAGMWILGVRDLRYLFGVSFAVAATVYILFMVLLKSRLPSGPLEAVLGSLLWGGS